MITRTLSRRLEKLEERMMSVGEPITVHIVPIRPDGTEASGGFSMKVPCYNSERRKRYED